METQDSEKSFSTGRMKIAPPNTCKYWVASRQRFCKFATGKDSSEFCPMHNTGSGANERVPCPVDPNHLVLKRDLDKHVLRCNKVAEDIFSSRQPFTLKGCNSIDISSDAPGTEPSNQDEQMSVTEIENWRTKLSSARESLTATIRAKFPNFSLTEEDEQFSAPWSDEVTACSKDVTGHDWETRDQIDKHNLQNACLLAMLNAADLAPKQKDHSVFVELGCGKAGLTRWLIHSLPERDPDIPEYDQPVFLLLDYEARRCKNENKKDAKSRIPSGNIVRLRSDIRDVDLAQFLVSKSTDSAPQVTGKPGSIDLRLSELHAKVHAIQARSSWPYSRVVGTAKHLCGAATDFGLRCLSRVKDREVSLVFATCCHHRCDWDQLVSRSILEEFDICNSRAEFKRLSSVAGWATTAGIDQGKRRFGRLVKSVIDLSRILWLVNTFPNMRSVGYKKYIEDGTTPENFCIVFS
jgi:tRNA:m4X modification enzyme